MLKQEHAIGIGLIAGIILAALGVTGVLRELWIGMLTPASARVPSPITVFSAYLIQTGVLTWLTFRAYRFEHYGITSAVWILATWEAIAMITRGNLLFMKRMNPTLYSATAFVHIVGAAALFLAMGIRTHRLAEQDRREELLSRQEYSRKR